MAFGWSPGDLVSLVRLTRIVYVFYRDAPDDVRNLERKLNALYDELERLSAILRASGWREYDRAPTLKTDLDDTHTYLKKFQELGEQGLGFFPRARHTTRIAVNQGERTRLDKLIDYHVDELRKFGQEVILCAPSKLDSSYKTDDLICRECTLRTFAFFEQGHLRKNSFINNGSTSVDVNVDVNHPQRTSAHPNQEVIRKATERDDSDNVSMISQASRAVELASVLTRKARTAASVSRSSFHTSLPPIDSSPETTEGREILNQYIVDVVSLAEKHRLYVDGQPSSPPLNALSEISSRIRTLKKNIYRSSTGVTSTSFGRITLPEIPSSPPDSFQDSIFTQLSRSTEDTRPPSVNSEAHVSLEISGTNNGSESHTDQTPPGSPNVLVFHQEGENGHAERSNQFDISRRETSVAPMQSSDESQTGDITSHAQVSFEDLGEAAKHRLTFTGTVRILHSFGHESFSYKCNLDFSKADESTPFDIIWIESINQGYHFQHLLTASQRPFPSLLHPIVDNMKGEGFKLSLKDQLLDNEEEPRRPLRVPDVEYVFSNAKDRDSFQGRVFGKHLLQNAGTDKIFQSVGGLACTMQNLSVWQEDITDGSSLRTITFFKNMNPQSNGYVEYEVRTVEQHKKPLKSKKPVTISVVLHRETVPSSLAESPLRFSIDSFSRRFSTTASNSPNSSSAASTTATAKAISCEIFFTRGEDRSAFLDIFKTNTSGG